jgi:hypothetical protein
MLISPCYEWKFISTERDDLSTEVEELSTIGRTFSTGALNQEAEWVLRGFNF